MAGVVLLVTTALSLTKSLLVIDAVFAGGRATGFAARATQRITSQTLQRATSQARHTISSPRQRQGRTSSAATSPPKVRSLHLRLLSMHATATVGQAAIAAKHLLRPISDSQCLVTHRLVVLTVLLYDASVVLFLLAKVHVTNGNRVLACWEKGIIWWSRFFSCIYLPYAAVFVSITTGATANSEGTFCYGRGEEVSDDSANFSAVATGVKNGLLVIQFVLLLGLFVKPMRAGQQNTQSGGAVYRRVIIRNIACTSWIVAVYAIATVIYVATLLGESAEGRKATSIRDVTLAITQVVTLFLTEIALPLGFAGCITSCKQTFAQERGQLQPGQPTKTAAQASSKVVVPVEDLPPQAAP